MDRWNTEKTFKAVKSFCVIPQWWTDVIIYVSKPTECTTPRVNHDVNYQFRFINCNKYATLVGDVYNGGGCVCTGGGNI